MTQVASLLVLASVLIASGYVVDHSQSVFKDAIGRQRFWHGVNFVKKDAPYYPTISTEDIDTMHSFGASVVRLGVMMPGMFPVGPTVNTTYLDMIQAIIDNLHSNGIETIIDLHQDVLAPKICGEGTPDWMLNISTLKAMAFPRPAAGFKEISINPNTGHPSSCGPIGTLKFIGWSEFYMTDECGKAFQQLYDGNGVMADAFAAYWKEIATRFKGHPGVMAYELLNEPWLGDHVHNPKLLLEGGKAEDEVAKYMKRMHDVVRSIDKETMIMYAPAELNNRLMRRVGYENGFLPEAAMSYHVYCITGTDGPGPTSPIQKQLCHFNDGFQMKQRENDLRRLQTAGFVTEFGAVQPVPTGLAEVEFVLDHLDAMNPPSSWAFWDFNELTKNNKTETATYLKTVARAYPRALAGEIQSMHFDSISSSFELKYLATAAGETELFLPVQRRFPNGFKVTTTPSDVLTVTHTSYGIKLLANRSTSVTVQVAAAKDAAALVTVI